MDRSGRPLGRSRGQVLDCLRGVGEPVGVAGVAEATGLHVNTARFHLDALVEDGLAERHTEAASGPGRPRILYSARSDGAEVRSYRLLAQMLADLVASLDPQGTSAAAAGRMWGHHLVEQPTPGERVEAADAVRRLRSLMADIGFEPEVPPDGGTPEVRIHHCPFREVAQQKPGVVCAVHLGLMQGALEELGAPLGVAGLDRFVTDHECVARLEER
ncbi:MAG TPA: helix-turn-helix domain-containing protein [Marmoricola sp.]|nr:helix-turn-helix domain-containing protein [Marmoricola sp.]